MLPLALFLKFILRNELSAYNSHKKSTFYGHPLLQEFQCLPDPDQLTRKGKEELPPALSLPLREYASEAFRLQRSKFQ